LKELLKIYQRFNLTSIQYKTMKKSILSQGKKLTRTELHLVNGGLGSVRCTNSSGYCVYIGPGCSEEKCQLPEPLEAVD